MHTKRYAGRRKYKLTANGTKKVTNTRLTIMLVEYYTRTKPAFRIRIIFKSSPVCRGEHRLTSWVFIDERCAFFGKSHNSSSARNISRGWPTRDSRVIYKNRNALLLLRISMYSVLHILFLYVTMSSISRFALFVTRT